MLKATLTFLERGKALVTATSMAELDAEDTDFLARHVQQLRDATSAQDALFSRFQHGSGIPILLGKLLRAADEEFVSISGGLASRLQAGMDGSTNPSPGVLAVIVSGEAETPTHVSVIKLDAVTEAASANLDRGHVKLKVWKDLLPAPGHLQKGVSWPDLRPESDAVVIDRNQTAAQYFFNSYEVAVSKTPREAERALTAAIVRGVEPEKRAEALVYAASLSGRGDTVAAQVKDKYPSVDTEAKELGAGGLPAASIRPGKLAGLPIRYSGDGVSIHVRPDRLDRITGPTQVDGGWEIRVRFPVRPKVDTG